MRSGARPSALFLAEAVVAGIRDVGSYQAIVGDGRGRRLRAASLGVVVLVATALVFLLLSSEYLVPRHGFESRPEYVALLLFSATGMLMMTTANDLIIVFFSLETLSIPLDVLAAFDRRRASLPRGLVWGTFVLGAFSAVVFLYGIALTYGATGTTSLGHRRFLSKNTLLDTGRSSPG